MSRKQRRRVGPSSQKRQRRREGRRSWLAAGVLAAVALAGLGAMLQGGGTAAASPVEFTDVAKQTRQFIDYYHSIKLTPEQELVKAQALSAIPAPCCSDKSVHTCCCPCNMAKSWWGFSHHLIANEGFGAEEVQAAVEEWIEFINPDGFTGDACYTGGCLRPFHRNGCGGMNEGHVVF